MHSLKSKPKCLKKTNTQTQKQNKTETKEKKKPETYFCCKGAFLVNHISLLIKVLPSGVHRSGIWHSNNFRKYAGTIIIKMNILALNRHFFPADLFKSDAPVQPAGSAHKQLCLETLCGLRCAGGPRP